MIIWFRVIHRMSCRNWAVEEESCFVCGQFSPDTLPSNDLTSHWDFFLFTLSSWSWSSVRNLKTFVSYFYWNKLQGTSNKLLGIEKVKWHKHCIKSGDDDYVNNLQRADPKVQWTVTVRNPATLPLSRWDTTLPCLRVTCLRIVLFRKYILPLRDWVQLCSTVAYRTKVQRCVLNCYTWVSHKRTITNKENLFYDLECPLSLQFWHSWHWLLLKAVKMLSLGVKPARFKLCTSALPAEEEMSNDPLSVILPVADIQLTCCWHRHPATTAIMQM